MHNFYTQNGWWWLQKSTLNNMDISSHKISHIKPGSLVCFRKLLQEYPLWSTYPSLKSKIKKENCIIWLFVFSAMVRSLPPKKIRFIYPKTVCLYSFIHYKKNNSINPIQARLFWNSCGQGAHCAPFWKPCSSCTNSLLFSFLKACPKLDQMTQFGFHGYRFKCFYGGSKVFFLQKLQTKDTIQMAIVLAFNES